MQEFGWHRARFVSPSLSGSAWSQPGQRRQSMGQLAATWRIRADTAVGQFDSLLKRIANIGDEPTRQDLMAWVGNPLQVGTPAERYKIVVDDLSQSAGWTDITTKRVVDLEGVVAALETKVKQGEQAHSPTGQPNQPGSVTTPSGALSTTGIVLVTLGLAGLLVVPFLLRE